MTKFHATGNLKGSEAEFSGELISPSPQERGFFGRVSDILNKPILLAIISGVVLATFSYLLESYREGTRLEIEAAREKQQRRVDDVRLVYGMLPGLIKTNEPEGIASRSLLAYLSDSAGADPKLREVVENALSPKTGASPREIAENTEANQSALGERSITLAVGQASDTESTRVLLKDFALAPRTFLHIAESNQRSDMSRLQDSLREEGIGAPGIELIRGNFPNENQVRYFHRQDRDTAEKVAAKFREITGEDAAIRLLSNYAREDTIGLTEVWFRGE